MTYTIALLGMPGSGKTELAAGIEEALVKEDGGCTSCRTPVRVVDDYAYRIRDHGDFAIGLEGGWMASIAVATERLCQERRAQADSKTVVLCGTMLESAVYMGMHFEEMAKIYTEAEAKDAALRLEAGMRLFAAMYMDVFHYNRVFYLPAINAPEGDRWRIFDKNLQASFQAFDLIPVEPLMDEGTLEEVTAKRLATVMARREEDAGNAQRPATTPSKA